MADVDTIVILNGLDHEQDITTSLIWDIDSTVEAVTTRPVHIPVSASQANIIFNNNYDPDGSTVFVMARLTKVTDITGVTKTENTEVLAWQEIAQGGFLESGSIDVSSSQSSTLHIYIALSSTTAHTGTEVRTFIGSEAGVDGSWTELPGGRFIGPIGTAFSTAFAATEPAGETVIAITNPTAGNLDNVGKLKFIENTVAADCEIVYQTECGADA